MLLAPEVVDRAMVALSQQSAGLFTDCDGTISPIVSSPEEATITADFRRSLSILQNRLALLAVVSGRTADEARRLVGVPGIVYVGNHGLEVWCNGEFEPVTGVQGCESGVEEALAEVADHLGPLPGVVFENKRLSASIHYRLADDPTSPRQAILRALRRSPLASQWRLVEGRKVIELRPPLGINKGSAVEGLIEAYALRGAVYLGDDATDLDAFRSLRAWSRRTGNPVLTVGVVSEESPTVAGEADLTLSGVWEVEELLRLLSSRLPQLGRHSVGQRHGAGRAVPTAPTMP